jgi:hypothetical protein
MEIVMKRGTKIAIGVGAALSLGLAALAGAHPGGYGPGEYGSGWGTGGGMGMGMMGGGMMGGGPGFMAGGSGMMGTDGYGIEERLAAQKSALKITSEQEGAWQAYAKVVKAQADLRSKLVKERFEQFEAVNAATKNLYGALTPEQRAIADQGAGFRPGFRGPGGRK